jgi:hypothetical protein
MLCLLLDNPFLQTIIGGYRNRVCLSIRGIQHIPIGDRAMIVIPHPIPAIHKIGTFIVKTNIQKIRCPGCAAAKGRLGGTPFFHQSPAMQAFRRFGFLEHTFT